MLIPADVALGAREPAADVARNLERWVDAVVIRTFAQQIVEEFATAAPRLRVVNALTDEEHPCQAAGRPAHAAASGSARWRAAPSPTSATATTSRRRWRTRA